MRKISKETNFVIRLTKNQMIYKIFIKMNKNSAIIKHNGYDMKLIKFSVDDKTRQIIKNKYKESNEDNNGDDDSFFVIATNLTNLSFKEMTNIYKKRWSVESCNKNIKSNFNIRHIVKQYNSLAPINKISFYMSLSIVLYNITILEKRLSEMLYYCENQKHIDYNYNQYVNIYKDYLIDIVNHSTKKIKMTHKRKERRLIMNKRHKRKKKQIVNNKIRGKYKSLEKMASLNKRNDILIQIKKYYKKVKYMKKIRIIT